MKNKTNGALTHWGSIQRTVLVAALSLASIPASAQTSASNGTEVQENAPIKIGAVVATAGPAALLGNSFVKAIQLAKEDARNTKHQYELVIEEIASSDKAELAIKKLIETDKVNALIVGFSMSGKIVKPYAAAANIPLFCICSVASVGDDLYTFTTMPVAEDEAAQWVAEAKRRGIKTVARLTQDYPSINNHVRAVKEEADSYTRTRSTRRPRISHPGSRPRKKLLPTSISSKDSNLASASSASSSANPAFKTWPRSWHSQSATSRNCSRAAGTPTATSVQNSKRGSIRNTPRPGLPLT